MDTTAWRASVPRWFLALGPLTASLLVGSVLAWTVADQPMVAVDAAFYQHVGWRVTRGAVPYIDVWDVNPPLTFALAAGLAFVSGGSMLLLHALSAAVTLLAVATSVLLVGWLAARVTGEDAAALAAGLVLLAVPEVYGLPPYGVRSQYFALLFVVVTLALARSDRPLLAGASVAAAAGFWQGGLVAVPIVLGILYTRRGGRALVEATAAGVAVAACTVLPFVVAGAAEPMVVETVVAPIYARSPYTLPGRAYAVVDALGYATVLLPVGAFGWLRTLESGDEWWIPAGGLGYAGFALFGNMDGSLDLLPFLAFVALGVAVAVERAGTGPSSRTALVALVVLAGLANPVWHFADPPPKDALENARRDVEADHEPAIRDRRLSGPGMRTIYWQQLRPERCHYRLSWTERRWLARTDATLDDESCGAWPG